MDRLERFAEWWLIIGATALIFLGYPAFVGAAVFHIQTTMGFPWSALLGVIGGAGWSVLIGLYIQFILSVRYFRRLRRGKEMGE